MSSGGFRADPDALTQMATRMEQAAGQLVDEMAAFSRSSQSAGTGTFGSLPAARAAYRAYLQKAEEAISGLRAIQSTLESDIAGGLRNAAASYVAADEESSASPL